MDIDDDDTTTPLLPHSRRPSIQTRNVNIILTELDAFFAHPPANLTSEEREQMVRSVLEGLIDALFKPRIRAMEDRDEEAHGCRKAGSVMMELTDEGSSAEGRNRNLLGDTEGLDDLDKEEVRGEGRGGENEEWVPQIRSKQVQGNRLWDAAGPVVSTQGRYY